MAPNVPRFDIGASESGLRGKSLHKRVVVSFEFRVMLEFEWILGKLGNTGERKANRIPAHYLPSHRI
jgi:hypothetical protein